MLLQVKDLTVRYGGHLAVWEAGFTLGEGEVLGLVGESGAGKSTIGRALLRLVPEPGRIVSGAITFKGRDLLGLPEAELRALRGAEITLIPQDPLAALNPAFRIGLQATDALAIHRGLSRREAEGVMARLLARMGIPDPEDALRRYPHELSGGMRQRVLIAIAFSCGPSLLVADEPTTSLDVTTQAQILRLLDGLRSETGVATCFITHDLGVVAHLTHRVAILYAGCLVEQAPTDRILAAPLHPYTRALVRSLPLDGIMPALQGPPQACPFSDRCPERMAICDTAHPPLKSVGAGHQVACHLY
ncbi:MAG: oligopeptide/dipeptide ABC transporter ATP-binding protein-like protein [Candidatus Rokubacteria bacterium CSP1-6]|nr:MAG: oligopeptide/dipeptide ABC transporter ATP-binding protein-like protein [Candidatus Rokubacteria bacterium CSP1-6]